MLKKILTATMLAAFASAPLAAQQATKPTATVDAKPQAREARTPEPPALPLNIKIEVSITDQTGSGTPAKKEVSMIAADRQNTSIRSNASVPVKIPASTTDQIPMTMRTTMQNVTINVDARPSILVKEPNKVLVRLGLEYLPKLGRTEEGSEAGMSAFSEQLGLILESGKPLVISQAADPTSDRRITVQVTATILK
jgi:hypothetical protein